MIASKNLFAEQSLAVPTCAGKFCALLDESKDIVAKAIVDNQPYAVCLMLSGGDDSITALHVANMLGVRIDFVIHGVTGTGLPEVRPFVRDAAEMASVPLLEANAGNAFEQYVMRKGFFGKGGKAHKFSYHILKRGPFNATISKHLRQRIRGRKIILLNGVRVEESENRADNYGDNPYRWDGSNLWVNIIHWWTKKECLELLDGDAVKRSPVSIALGRSGECNCGTMQSEADRMAASEFNPAWGDWMADLRKQVVRKHGWDIGQNPPKSLLQNRDTNLPLDDFMPMCVGCKSKALKLF